jgi:hypothetical protein
MNTPASNSSSKTAPKGGQKQAKGGQKPNQKGQTGGGNQGGPAKLRGLPKDSPEVRLSKTITWILRHGAQMEGLPMRGDGYIKVEDLVRFIALLKVGYCIDVRMGWCSLRTRESSHSLLISPGCRKL